MKSIGILTIVSVGEGQEGSLYAVCLNFFSAVGIKYSDKSKLKDEGLVFNRS